MDDWQVGDLALCVFTGKSEEGFTSPELTLGRTYHVIGVGHDPLGQVGLFLDELESTGFAGGFIAARFRKIRPLSDEERDAFTADLSADQRIPVPAGSQGASDVPNERTGTDFHLSFHG